MQIDGSSEKPIFIQVAEGIEEAILSGAFPEEGQIPSITEFAVTCRINPATALKGINILVDKGILYKKRGIGMFVAEGAPAALRLNRREGFFSQYIVGLVAEAKRLDISPDAVKDMVDKGFID